MSNTPAIAHTLNPNDPSALSGDRIVDLFFFFLSFSLDDLASFALNSEWGSNHGGSNRRSANLGASVFSALGGGRIFCSSRKFLSFGQG